jgi:predicted extracellular nuclease
MVPVRVPVGAALLSSLLLAAVGARASEVVITGVIDGPLSGGVPKAVELYVVSDVTDLSVYGLESANNGAEATGPEFIFPSVPAEAGSFLYVASEAPGFEGFFGFSPDYTDSALSINGDDAVVLYEESAIADVFGEIGVDGTGQPWDHVDGWAYRADGSGPDGSVFRLGNWAFSGVDALDGETTNATASTPFPLGTFGGGNGGAGGDDGSGDGADGGSPESDLVLTGVVDGPLPGGLPKAIELLALADIEDLSAYGIESANNGGGVVGPEFVLPAQGVAAGTYLYVASEATGFQDFFGFPPDFTNGAANVNGDDAIALYRDGRIVDVYGEPAVDGTGQGWEYTDSWAYRVAGTGPDGASFVAEHWTIAGPDVLDGATGNALAATPFPIGSFAGGSDGDEPPAVARVGIHDVQGTGATVAITTPVEIQGVVTALSEVDDVLDGFFVQEETVDEDDDPRTSEGIFVFCRGNCPTELAPDDLVTVAGTPGEFSGMSQINAQNGTIVRDAPGAGGILATTLHLPAAGSTRDAATFEAIEGMLVELPDTLFVSEYFELARFGSIVLTQGSRPQQFTNANAPGAAGLEAFLEDLNRRRIILDDGNNDQNDAIFGPAADEPYAYPEGGFSTENLFRGGDTVTGLVGVLQWAFGAWRLQPVPSFEYAFARENPRTEAPEDTGGRLKVASLNVLNYFTTVDLGPDVCGPALDADCRGADSVDELARQTDKLVTALRVMDADVVGLVEIQNDDASTAILVEALNATGGQYDFVATGAIGTDAIKVALIYDASSVKPVGGVAILDSGVDPRFVDTLNRPVLAQTFEERATSARFTVAVAHLKSKGSSCQAVGDPDAGDGQGNCNGVRTEAARAMVDWLASDPTGSGDPDVLLIGDLNAYAQEDPITEFRMNGFTDLVNLFVGADAYSFVFDGQLGYLDHALAGASMADQVSGATVWHINADEVNVLDYNDALRDPGEAAFERESGALPLYHADPYRSSDHDPIVVGLDLAFPTPAVRSDCRDGGWRSLRRDDGSAFENQGQCIRFVTLRNLRALLQRKAECRNAGWRALTREDGTPFGNEGLCIRYALLGR